MSKTSLPSVVIVISDCRDDNARVRVECRIQSLFPHSSVKFIGVASPFEAAGNLVDVISALAGCVAAIIVNVAPRGAASAGRTNGSPFGWIKFKDIDIFSTIDGGPLDLLAKVTGEQFDIKVFDIERAALSLDFDPTTQFRSLEVFPKLAAAACSGEAEGFVAESVPYEPSFYTELPWIWLRDIFGNLKTNFLFKELITRFGTKITLTLPTTKTRERSERVIGVYLRLKDVPEGSFGLIQGSSGLGKERFAELVLQGSSAANALDLRVGDKLVLSTHVG